LESDIQYEDTALDFPILNRKQLLDKPKRNPSIEIEESPDVGSFVEWDETLGIEYDKNLSQ
jgi:hypothetical protein